MYDVVELTRDDINFHGTIGKFAIDRKVVGEIGYNIYDSPNCRWFVAVEGGIILAISSLDGNKFGIAYVSPKYRKNGIHKAMVQARLDACNYGRCIVVCNNISMKAYIDIGFTEYKTSHKWHWLEYNKEQDNAD